MNETVAKFDAAMSVVTLVCLGVSVICLSAHILATLVVPELHNLAGKNLVSLSTALLGGYSSFIATMFVDRFLGKGCRNGLLLRGEGGHLLVFVGV